MKMENQATTARQESKMLTGLFSDKESSEGAYRSLRDRGYSDDEITVIMSDETRNKWFGDDDDSELGTNAAVGTGYGSAIGGTVGSISGGISAVGANLVRPG